MPRKKREGSDFGERLVAIRRSRGLTQVQLARAIGSTQRAISYYETRADYPPAPVVMALAKALEVSCDEIMGAHRARAVPAKVNPEARRLWKRFQRVLTLPEKDQRAVIRLVSSLAQTTSPGAHRAPRDRGSSRSRRLQHA